MDVFEYDCNNFLPKTGRTKYKFCFIHLTNILKFFIVEM